MHTQHFGDPNDQYKSYRLLQLKGNPVVETGMYIASEEMSDGVLIQQASEGNEEAFEILVRRYRAVLFRLIYYNLGNYHSSHDVLQHVFIQLYVSLKKIQVDASLKAWLFQVARRRCYDELRKKRVAYFSELESVHGEEEDPAYENIPDLVAPVEELVEERELQEALQHAIAKLPQKYRMVILLRYQTRQSFSQIGRQLHVSEATATPVFFVRSLYYGRHYEKQNCVHEQTRTTNHTCGFLYESIEEL